MIRRVSIVAIAVVATGCMRHTEFHCQTADQCGAGGTCEAIGGVGYCAFPDQDCGLRFGDSAGPYANQCVTGITPGDAGIDAPNPIDAPPDAPISKCPGAYHVVAAAPGHLYQVITTADTWQNVNTFCMATSTSAYLMIPDNQPELDALDAIAGVADYWIGINGSASNDLWTTVKNTTPSFLPWGNNQPDQSTPPKDCVEARTAAGQFFNERCSTKLAAICECEP